MGLCLPAQLILSVNLFSTGEGAILPEGERLFETRIHVKGRSSTTDSVMDLCCQQTARAKEPG